jgi:hypothetical protein
MVRGSLSRSLEILNHPIRSRSSLAPMLGRWRRRMPSASPRGAKDRRPARLLRATQRASRGSAILSASTRQRGRPRGDLRDRNRRLGPGCRRVSRVERTANCRRLWPSAQNVGDHRRVDDDNPTSRRVAAHSRHKNQRAEFSVPVWVGWTMSNITQLVPRTDDRIASPDQSELLHQASGHVVALTDHVITLEQRIADQAARIADLESRSPPPPFTIPAHWLSAKQAAHATGYSRQSIYRFFHSREAIGIQHGGTIYVDPDSIPERWSRPRRRR